ncbi:hypothetical protein Lalb_Chr21g0308071 [Lupinus albus]|uniref:Uncharacterized protein n=1 Tax=Lupinus albus TaxID=3870 RepID=A0A6A4N504_LUPAL|nr:hypothetical protein Lalb_Chr21g0308071 [Lupinus albus]
MKTTQKTMLVLSVLILMHFIMCSIVLVNRESESNHIPRFRPRKLLAHVLSFTASVDKLKISHEASQRSIGASLKKAPRSYSNPSHNK